MSALRVLHHSKWRPGMVVARPLVSDEGETLVDKGDLLEPGGIDLLLDHGYDRITLDLTDEFSEGLEHVDPRLIVSAVESLTQQGVHHEDQVDKIRDQIIEDALTVCDLGALAPVLGYTQLASDTSRQSLDRGLRKALKPQVIAGLLAIKSFNPQYYVHAFATTAVAIPLGKAVDLPSHRMEQLVAGTILHDIGKVFLPDGLDEHARLRLHPLLGYQVLRRTEYVDALAAQIALQHHECPDGSGEPLGIIGSNSLQASWFALPPLPTLLAEIVAIADYYANRTMGTGAEGPIRPDIVLKDIAAGSGTMFNSAIVEAYMATTGITTEGSEIVARSSGEYQGFRGRVVRVNEERLNKPVISLTHNSMGEAIEPVEINLLEDIEFGIERRRW